jgi:NADH-quinone oxidoreductase subunit M
VIFAAVYMLWSFQRAFTGRTRSNVAKMKDVNFRELVVVVPLIGLSLFLGIYPKPVLERIEPAAQHAVENFERKTNYRSPEHEKELVHRQDKVEKGADAERDHPERAAKKAEARERENEGGDK